jgi:hypothetical protein
MDWLWKLISGWLPLGINSSGGKKSFGEWSGKILWVVGIVLLVMFATNILEKIFPNKPNVINNSAGGVIQMAEPRDMMGFGCNFMRAYVRAGVKAK